MLKKKIWLGWLVVFVLSFMQLNIVAAQERALPIGFEFADTDHDRQLSQAELRDYLQPRLKNMQLPYAKIFSELDVDRDERLSEKEFEPRNQVIQKFIELHYSEVEIAKDPGAGFVPLKSLSAPIDDTLTFSAIYHRTLESSKNIPPTVIDLQQIPRGITGAVPASLGPSNFELACRATAILGGGNSEESFFSGGGVIISPDGLMLSNYHIAESINDGITALLSDGRVARVQRVIAGNPETDVALLQLEGTNFPCVPIARSVPAMEASH
jgi:hypothetical protein